MSSIHVQGQTKQKLVVAHGPSLSVSLSPDDVKTKQPGTLIMGPPVNPKVHVDHQKAAMWTSADHQMYLQRNNYIQHSVVDQKPANNPMNNLMTHLTKKADTTSRSLWHNLKLGPSVTGTATGKITLTAKALNEGGFESLFKQSFETNQDEKLKKWFACYLSTTTGPVSGTLYLSTARVAFCSDRPLVCKCPSGQQTYSYYKVTIPLASIGKVNAVIEESPPEKYIQIMTVDGLDFWFMGFVSFEKAAHQLFKNAPQTHAYGFNRQTVTSHEAHMSLSVGTH